MPQFKNPNDAANSLVPNAKPDDWGSAYDEYVQLVANYKNPDLSKRPNNSKYNRPSVTDWVNAFNKGAFNGSDVKNQITAGWWDWFSDDNALVGKTKTMGNIINRLKPGGKLNFDDNYVWFKNNAPFSGDLYDDFRFANRGDGEVQFTNVIKSPHEKNKYAVYGRRNKGEEFSQDPLFQTDDVEELINWYNTPWDSTPPEVKKAVVEKLLGSKSRFAAKYPDRFENLKNTYSKTGFGSGDLEQLDLDEIARILGIDLD